MLELVTYQALIDAILSPAVIVDDSRPDRGRECRLASFAEKNGGDVQTYYVGRNYLVMCGDGGGDDSSAEAPSSPTDCAGVLGGDSGFRCEYPCHSPDRDALVRGVDGADPPTRPTLRLVSTTT